MTWCPACFPRASYWVLAKCAPATDSDLGRNTTTKISLNTDVRMHIVELVAVFYRQGVITIEARIVPEEAVEIERAIIRNLHLSCEGY